MREPAGKRPDHAITEREISLARKMGFSRLFFTIEK
jgi:hypothetical protein